MTDSKGNKAYFCHRSDREPFVETVVNEGWSYKVNHYPALLFALDGSWIKEFDTAMPFFGLTGPTTEIRNADVLAVMQDGKWGAVNMKGETIIPIDRDSYEGIYSPDDGGIGGFAVTGDRFMGWNNEYIPGLPLQNLYDGKGNLIATGLLGWRPEGMAGEFFVTCEWGNKQDFTVYTYTLDGGLIAEFTPGDDGYGSNRYNSYAEPFGDYVWVCVEKNTLICDRELNILHDFAHVYDEAAKVYRSNLSPGPNMLYNSDRETLFHRTYLPDGTRLVTWYDPEMVW